jgi:hypothetical protein
MPSYDTMPWDQQLDEIERSIVLVDEALLVLQAQSLAVQARMMTRRAQMARFLRSVQDEGKASGAANFSAAIRSNTVLAQGLQSRYARLSAQSARLRVTRAAVLRAQTAGLEPGQTDTAPPDVGDKPEAN